MTVSATFLRRRVLPALLPLFSLMPASAPAANAWHTARPVQVYPHGDGSVALILNAETGSNCQNRWAAGGANYYYIKAGENGVTPEGARNMLAVALTAQMSGRQVSLYYDDGTLQCFINRMVVYDR